MLSVLFRGIYSMKRFIDLTDHLYPGTDSLHAFCFFCSVRDSFEVFAGHQYWRSWIDFEEHYMIDFKAGYRLDELRRYKRLCPAWVFEADKKRY
jgi:hypothetical protein